MPKLRVLIFPIAHTDGSQPPVTDYERRGLIKMVLRLRKWIGQQQYHSDIPVELQAGEALIEMENLLGIEPPPIEPIIAAVDRDERGEEDSQWGSGRQEDTLPPAVQGEGGFGSAALLPIPKSVRIVFKRQDVDIGAETAQGFDGTPVEHAALGPEATDIEPEAGHRGLLQSLGSSHETAAGSATHKSNGSKKRKPPKKVQVEEEEEEVYEEIEEISEDDAAQLPGERDGGEFVLGRASRRGSKPARVSRYCRVLLQFHRVRLTSSSQQYPHETPQCRCGWSAAR